MQRSKAEGQFKIPHRTPLNN